MVLDFGDDLQTIFKHSKEFDQGVGTRQERKGQGTVVVSLDGSGDTDNIQEAINLLPTIGGSVFIKEGTYTIPAILNFNKNNIELNGVGNATIIKPKSVMTQATILISGKSGCIIKDIQIDNTNTPSTSAIQLISSATNNLITGCIFKNMNLAAAIDIDTCTNNILNNNNFINNQGVNLATASNNILQGNIGGNNYNIDANSDNNLIVNNIMGDIIIANANCNKNILLGNVWISLSDSGTDTQIGHNITV